MSDDRLADLLGKMVDVKKPIATTPTIARLKIEYPACARAIEWAQTQSGTYGRQLLAVAVHLREQQDLREQQHEIV
jgi:hypothetical protein